MEIISASLSRQLLLTCNIALQFILLWSCATSQTTGFLSIDCGSVATSLYTDTVTGIQWISDSGQTNIGGTPTDISGGSDRVLSTMRLFNGNQTKNCYSLTNSAVQAGAFFLVRASFWAGLTPPYMPQNSDGSFRFKLIVDAAEWIDVKIPYGTTTWWSYEVYVRAQGSSIDMCLARITPTGDAPFINALELRPLPDTLTSTSYMDRNDRTLVVAARTDYGVPSSGPSSTRYPNDALDRIWFSSITDASDLASTDAAIDVTNHIDQPPARILQNSYTTSPSFFSSFSSLDPTALYIVEYYFAEIDPAVNASGQRTFNILANGEVLNTEGAIDVFAAVGANSAYSYAFAVSPNATGGLTFNFTPTATSPFPPFVAAAEFFDAKAITAVTTSTVVSAVEEIKTSLGLSRFTGDPCLPVGYGYSWLTCSDSGISALNLSNYYTGGEIPTAISSLTALTEVHLDGNALQGEIPDLSTLVNLETLDLSNNKLSGSIPSSLATLKNLKVLYLQNNNLSGEIPADLLQRKKASQLTFEFSENPLCETSNGECSPLPSSPAPNSSPSQSNKKSNTGIIVGVAVAGVLLVGIVIGIVVYCFCLKKPDKMKVRTDRQQASLDQELPQIYETPSPGIKVIPKLTIKEFTFQEIIDATSNFRTKLGQGGFGPVYKGLLQDGCLVAVKVSSKQSHEGSREFLNEVDLLSRVHHKKLVGLLGYSNDEEKLVLVYEFMSNGSLFDCLHGPYSKSSPLSWATRLHIMVDAAQGLDYLHHGCSPPIIHRDVKSSNILLNDRNEAKISDFGISRDYMRNETGAPPTALMGSMGYIDLEYLSSMKLTEKVDVYSFGVLLFEVVCGKMAVFQDSSQQPMNLVEWVKAFVDRGVIEDIVDASLHGQFDVQSVWKVVDVALACVEMPGFKRPKMSDVYLELREAKRMELQSEERDAIDKPSVEFTGGTNYSTLSYTNISAR